jgi:phage baseplate assembly protein W
VSATLRHLGRGWAFPVLPRGAERALAYVGGPDKVRESIQLILETEPGERLMRPDFGCGLRRHLMQPNTTAVRALIKRDVELALGTWEPRIAVTGVDVTPGADPALVLIAIAYRHLVDNRPDNLVYPFHLE